MKIDRTTIYSTPGLRSQKLNFKLSTSLIRMILKDLPMDVIEDIFAKLPVKSLVRFKCLSKSFSGKISSLPFITKHFNLHSILPIRNHPLWIVRRVRCRRQPSQWSAYNCEIIKLGTAAETSGGSFHCRYPVELQPLLTDVTKDHLLLFGPCSGIFCLYYGRLNSDNHLVLWNPAMRDVKVLPPSHLKSSESARLRHGFGVDPKIGHCKVVRILKPFWRSETSPKVEVYDLSTNSWTIIDVPVSDLKTCSISHFSTFFNGVSHWLLSDEDFIEKELLCFNMGDEVFFKMKLPAISEGNEDDENFGDRSKVAVIHDCIAYVRSNRKNGCSECWFEIWVMNDYGVEESWTKAYNVGPYPRFYSLWGFHEDGEILAGNSSNLFSYNFDMQQMQEYHEAPCYGGIYQVFRFMETIFPLSSWTRSS